MMTQWSKAELWQADRPEILKSECYVPIYFKYTVLEMDEYCATTDGRERRFAPAGCKLRIMPAEMDIMSKEKNMLGLKYEDLGTCSIP